MSKNQFLENSESEPAIPFTSDSSTPSDPKLYSKKLIYIFSILFSPLIGSLLMMRNFKELNNNTARFQVLLFGILYTGVATWLLIILDTKYNPTIVFNVIGAAVISEYFWNKRLGKEIEHQKRSGVMPTIIVLLIVVGLIALNILGR